MPVYSGGAQGGFVKERMIAQPRFMPQLTAGAEAANVIDVAVSMTTFQEAGNDWKVADEVVVLEAVLFDDNGLEAVVGAFRLAETGDGAEVSATAQPRLFLTTSAAGAATLSVTDVVGATGATVHLLVRPLNKPGFPAHIALTFD